MKIEYNKILEADSSFGLVRTNPKLTGNIKLTVDSSNNLWLDAIPVNSELAKEKYSKVAVDTNGTLAGSIYKFFNNGQTPNEIIFSLEETIDTTRTSKNFNDQYDFSYYFSGANYLVSNKYSEKFSYFAPLYLKKDIPNYFIIFKIKDPANKPLDQLKLDYPYDNGQYLRELFQKATIIKTFDLSETSKVGAYLRKYIGDPSFPKSSLNVSYDETGITSFNGIVVNSGILGGRGEELHEFYQTAYPLKFSEEYVTLGFERNGVIFPNIVNLQFAFDDTTSKNYEINRYLGVYVNAIELTKLDLDLNSLFQNRAVFNNLPTLKREYFENEDATVYQSNSSGMVFPYKNKSIKFSDFENCFVDDTNLFFPYLLDKDNSIYSPKLPAPFTLEYDSMSGDELNTGKILLSNASIDYGKFFGPFSDFLQDTGFAETGPSHSSIDFEILSELQHLDSIKFYHPNGTRTDGNGKYDLLVGTDSYSLVPNPGNSYAYIDIDGVLGYDEFYFNCTGSTEQIASAIFSCINEIRTKAFKIFRNESTLIIKSSSGGDKDLNFALQFTSSDFSISSIRILSLSGLSLDGELVYFEGGTLNKVGRLVIEADHRSKILQNIDDLLVRTKTGWSKIKKVSNYSDPITEKAFSNKATREKAIIEYYQNIVLILEDDVEPEVSYTEYTIRLKYRPSFGLLSLFPVKDFDFDFYSSQYDNFPEIDLYATHYVPENIANLIPGVEYSIIGNGSIKLSNGSIIHSSDPQPFTVASELTYSRFVGNVLVSYYYSMTSPGDSTIVPISDLNEELTSFPGFSILKDQFIIKSESQDQYFKLKTKYFNGATPTEYDYYKENENVDFALRSRILPYITKWGIEDGTDARGNAYRFNTETAFGYNNFSPDHVDNTQNPSNFTHEWFYIESMFNYNLSEDTVKLNNYYFDYPFDESLLLSNPEYFVNYFTYSPKVLNSDIELGDTQFRYTNISKNILGEYQAIFKGFKMSFKDVIDPTLLQEDNRPVYSKSSTRFEGYKFSALLRVKKEDINDPTTPPISYRIIEHKDYKFILVLIEVSLGDISDIDDYRKELYGAIVNGKDPDAIQPTDSDMYSVFPSGDYSYQTINGDYRISFTNIDGIEVSNLSHLFLYAFKNKKYNALLDSFSNVKLASKVNLSDSDLPILENTNYPNYPFSLKEETTPKKTPSTYLGVRFLNNGKEYILDQYDTTGLTPLFSNPIVDANANFLILSDSATSPFLIDSSTEGPFQPIPSALSSNFYKNYGVFKIINGGELYYESFFSKLSFANFKKYVNEYSPFIQYESYSLENGVSVKSDSSNFYVEVISPKEILKTSALVVQEDTDRPTQFSSTSAVSPQKYEGQKLSTLPNNTVAPLIGYKYGRVKLVSPYHINRYDGGYEPIFKGVSKYVSTFTFTDNEIDALDQSNTKINVYSDNFYTLPNFSHIKIADTKILTLESDEQYDPVYELIDEIAIGKKDLFVLQSNWDYGFHHKYSSKFLSQPVPGSLRIEEDTAFLSKLMQLPNSIELETFVKTNVSPLIEIKDIDQTQYELAFRETQLNVNGLINCNNVLTSYLLANGFSQVFEDFIPATSEYIGNYTSMTEYVKAYIASNIHRLYEIETIEFYTKVSAATTTTINAINPNSIDFVFLNDAQRYQQGYTLSKDFKINKTGKLNLTYEFNKPINAGLLISPKIKIKFI